MAILQCEVMEQKSVEFGVAKIIPRRQLRNEWSQHEPAEQDIYNQAGIDPQHAPQCKSSGRWSPKITLRDQIAADDEEDTHANKSKDAAGDPIKRLAFLISFCDQERV